ncbi:hypothetical protein GCM10011369_21320 [Neiella marina]|uniref:VPLPA-CTERM sorting domain-containing protein n=1 Tax=Neiella marina TaxID=508461 RepID=A0A8J2U5E5_9GAMM|nr:hypothetical protein [Neiella marina]GGA79122.1 hypothetical protein GCM10011369_21320 [Neiella marina]
MRALILVLMLGASCHVQAGLIAMSGTFDFVRDQKGSALDWMNLSYNEGRIFSDVLADTAVGGIYQGWRLATRSEFNTMLASLGYNIGIDPSEPNYAIDAAVPTGRELFSLKALVDLFGDTWESFINRTDYLTLKNGDTNTMYSGGLLASDNDPSSFYLGFLSQGEFHFSDDAGNDYSGNHVPYFANNTVVDVVQRDAYSSFLVRDIPTVLPVSAFAVRQASIVPATQVSEPISWLILLFGAASIIVIRKKSTQK